MFSRIEMTQQPNNVNFVLPSGETLFSWNINYVHFVNEKYHRRYLLSIFL